MSAARSPPAGGCSSYWPGARTQQIDSLHFSVFTIPYYTKAVSLADLFSEVPMSQIDVSMFIGHKHIASIRVKQQASWFWHQGTIYLRL